MEWLNWCLHYSCSSVTPDPSFTPDPALRNAIDERVATIPEQDRASFQTAGDIMHKISAMDAKYGQSSFSRDFGTRIERLLHTVKNFVAIVGPCVQSIPLASIVVGGLNAVLSVSLGAHTHKKVHVHKISLTLNIKACTRLCRLFRQSHDHDGENCRASGLFDVIRFTDVSELTSRSKSSSSNPLLSLFR